jgi:hypothetical protein
MTEPATTLGDISRIPCLLHTIDKAMVGITEFFKDEITVMEHTRRVQKWFDKDCYIEK